MGRTMAMCGRGWQFLPSCSTIYRGHVTRDTCPHQLILLHITSHADLSEELIGTLLSALAQPGPSLPDAGPVIVVAGSLVMSHKSSLEVLFVCFAGVRIVAAAWAADWLLLVITQD